MSEYKPPYYLTENMLSFVASISEKLGKLNVYSCVHEAFYLRLCHQIRRCHEPVALILLCLYPVSYTHLDVYKRQVLFGS